MKLPTFSLRALLIGIVVVAVSLAALRSATESVAWCLGIALCFLILAAVAMAIGAQGALRSSCAAFAVCSTLMLYLNQDDRTLLTSLPSSKGVVADWLNHRFGWAEWTGPPNTFVYWSSGNFIHYVSFDENGAFRSRGRMTRGDAERVGLAVDLDNLPEDLEGPSMSAFREIVALLSALAVGLVAALVACAAGRRSMERQR